MLTKDINGKTLSNSFNSAITSFSQFVKPKITINLLESKHISLNGNITNTNSHNVTSEGSLGYFFSEKQMINGYEREGFSWAVTDALQKDGTVIKADGSWYAMPSDIDDGYEFGYWTKDKSQANGVFASQPTITIPFTERKVNKIRVTTSESLGQVKSFRIRVLNANIGPIIDETVILSDDEYFKDIYIKTNEALSANSLASSMILNIISTKNGLDCGRIQEINPIYEVDITDYVISYSVSRTRDVHESNLPIGGTQNPRIAIALDNSSKDWNIFSNSSLYGQYMKKDLKINVATGWRIKKTDDVVLTTKLRSNLSNSSNIISVADTEIFPEGGAGNNFIITINPDKQNMEMILCNNIADTYTINVTERGYGPTSANSHLANSIVQFDPYEYVEMGTYFVDEWSASSSDMQVQIAATDWGKFLNEKILDEGFLFEDTMMGEAVKNLVLRSNFPNKDFIYLKSYTGDYINKGAIASYSFNEEIIDRSGNILKLSPGLRIRLYGMKSGREYYVKDIVSDALDRELSKEDLATGVERYIAPDVVYVTSDISGNTYGANATLSLQDYSFVGSNSVTYTKYFNGTVDGYYIPLQNGLQNIELDITNGGARIYLDDTVIAESWQNNKSQTTLSAYQYLGNLLNLQAGVPYKLKIDFFHADGDANFRMHLFKNNSALNSRSLILDSETRTVVAKDALGCLNPTSNTALANFNHHYNHAIYYSNVEMGKQSEINEYNQRSAHLVNDGYIRIPKSNPILLGEKDFTYEMLVNFNVGPFGGDGEYLSTWANSSPSNGIEFYYSGAGTHGVKVITTSGVETVSVSNVALSSSEFTHILASYDQSSKILSYYINGVLRASSTLTGNIVTQTTDYTIGGRGASFTANVGPTDPLTAREMYIDEFAIYEKHLTAEDVKDRFISFKLQELTKFKFIYDQNNSIRQSIDSITLADLGRFYIDEIGKGRYEHYYRFYEDIDQHANIQATFSDSTNIISADYQVQLQANKVVVKVPSVDKNSATQSIWTAEDPTTLAVVTLTTELNAVDTEMNVSTTTDPPFFNSGYLIIDDEIIKYNNKADNAFLSLERGVFGTTPAVHTANSHIREVRYYEITYEKSPAYQIKSPLIIAIFDEEPDLIEVLKFNHGPYAAELMICASNNVSPGSIVYAQGTNPLTEKLYYTGISGVPVIISNNNEKLTEQVESLSENIRLYGLKEITIDSPYITDIDHAKKIASFIIEKTKEPVPILNLSIMSVPTIQLGDRIRISSMNSLDIINGDYWVISQDFSYSDSVSHSLVLRKVS